MDNVLGTRFEIINTTLPLKAQIYLHSENRIIDVREHWHRSIELTLFIDGEYSYRINRELIKCRKNDIILINSGDIHSCRATNLKNLEAVTLNIPYKFFHENGLDIDSLVLSLDSNTAKKEEIKREMLSIFAYFKQRSEIPYCDLILNSYIYKILYILFRYCSYHTNPEYTLKENKSLGRSKEIISFILENYQENITQESTAELFGMTREHLSRFFRKQTGITFRDFLNSVRIRHAYLDLINTEKSITEIAVSHGYSDSRGFTRQFKIKNGC